MKKWHEKQVNEVVHANSMEYASSNNSTAGKKRNILPVSCVESKYQEILLCDKASDKWLKRSNTN